MGKHITVYEAINHDGNEAIDAEDSLSRIWHHLIRNAAQEIDEFEQEMHSHCKYVHTLGLRSDENTFQVVEQQLQLTRQQLSVCQEVPDQPLWQLRGRYRLLLQQVAFLRTSLQWCSPSTDQSLDVMFFDPAEQKNLGVNYARYGTAALHDFEQQLVGTLGFDPEEVALLTTSSGMAAYQLLETFLIRNVLQSGDRILYAPYVYFEVAEQMQSLQHFQHVTCSTYAVDEIIRATEACDAKVVFVDPIAKVAGVPTVDLRELAIRIANRDWHDRWLIIDGTLVSGGVNPFAWFTASNAPQVLYYESGSKYLQMGLDLQTAGICVFDADLLPQMLHLRRNSGTTMYQKDVFRFPMYEREHLLAHMRLLTRNAQQLARAIQESISEDVLLQVGFPSNWQQLGWAHGGGTVTCTFRDQALNTPQQLDALIEVLLGQCRAMDVPLTKGVSFGFSATRVLADCAYPSTANDEYFLRFSVGEEDKAECDRLCNAVSQVLRDIRRP